MPISDVTASYQAFAAIPQNNGAATRQDQTAVTARSSRRDVFISRAQSQTDTAEQSLV